MSATVTPRPRSIRELVAHLGPGSRLHIRLASSCHGVVVKACDRRRVEFTEGWALRFLIAGSQRESGIDFDDTGFTLSRGELRVRIEYCR